MLDIQTLQCFVEATRASSFREAARAVALSPAAFGQRIQRLEEQLDVKLFRRTTRSVTATKAGLDLLPQARRVLAAIDDCVRAARGELGHAPMELTLGTRHELGTSWIVPQLAELERARPGLTLHLYFGSGEDLVLRVRVGEIDCAITSTRLTDPKVHSAALHEERYVFVGQPALLRRCPLGSADDAAAHTLLDTNGALPLFQYWREAEGAFDSMHFARVRRLGTIAAIRQLATDGAGVAVLPEYYVRAQLKARKLRRILPAITPRSDFFRLVFRADDPRRPLFMGLAESLRSTPLR